MSKFFELFAALWNQDFQTLSNPEVAGTLYAILLVVLILENGFLPTTFLPGDSLLLLTGALIANGPLDYWMTIAVLTVGASVGCWIGYLQGLWLGEHKFVQKWLNRIPKKYHDKTEHLLEKYGLTALLIARFTAFVRTLMPYVIGITEMHPKKFQLVNWGSGFLWVFLLVNTSYWLGHTEFFKTYQSKIMTALTLVPVFFIIVGIVTMAVFVWKRRKEEKNKTIEGEKTC